MSIHPVVAAVTARIAARSGATRQRYLATVAARRGTGAARPRRWPAACDKIVPGLLIGALQFGHLPAFFVPAGPMTSGLSDDEKAKVRQLHAHGKVDRAALLEAESLAHHGPGTCTFYGTANSNQLPMEVMGLHLPGAAFVTPNTPLRAALAGAAASTRRSPRSSSFRQWCRCWRAPTRTARPT